MSGEKVWVVVPGQSTTAFLDTEHPATDGDVPTYEASTGLWKAQPGGGGGGAPNIDDGTTAETDTAKVLAPDGAGGVDWVTPSAPGGVDFYFSGKWEYDFAIDGGAIGTIQLRNVSSSVATIPTSAYILDGFTVCSDDLFSATDGATIHLDVNAAQDFYANSTPSQFLHGVQQVSGVLGSKVNSFANSVFTGSSFDNTAIHTTAQRHPVFVIEDEALEGGKFTVFMRWVVL